MENAKRKVNKKLGKRPRRETLVQKGLIKDYVKQALAAPPVQSATGRHHSVHLADSHKRKIKEEAKNEIHVFRGFLSLQKIKSMFFDFEDSRKEEC